MEARIFGDLHSDEVILEVKNISVKRSGKLILKDINFSVKRGEFVGLVGPNGSGKSTLLLTLLGILKFHQGEVTLYGHQPLSNRLSGKIGWVAQAASNLPSDIRITVRELVRLGTINGKNMFRLSDGGRRKRVDKAIEMVGLENVQHRDIARLSGGQRQRAVIARALASESEFILLDEPLVGIDRESRNSLLKLLDWLCHEEGKTILMVSHDLTAIRQTAHRMIFLEQSIRFDGKSEDFPDLVQLASLRGIGDVHDHGHEHHHHQKEEE